MKEILKVVGLDPERIKIIYCTAAEGQKFQNEAIEIDKTIRKLGPSPLRSKKSTPKEKAKAKAKA
jgi:coenzyme F420-reducing hydrogenase delta subunit